LSERSGWPQEKVEILKAAYFIQTVAVSIAAKKSLKLSGIMECGKAWEEPGAAMITQRQKAFSIL